MARDNVPLGDYPEVYLDAARLGTDALYGLPLRGHAFMLWYRQDVFKELGLEEAARVDGSTTLGVLRHVTFPLILPGIIVSAAFAFISTWNEFIFALVVGGQRVTLIQVGLN